jgi:transposase
MSPARVSRWVRAGGRAPRSAPAAGRRRDAVSSRPCALALGHRDQREGAVAELDQRVVALAHADQIGQLDRQLRQRVARLVPSLLSLPGCGAADRGQAHRRDRRRGPVPLRGLFRHARRGGTRPGQLRPHRPPSAVTRRQPPAECRPAPHRRHPAAPAPLRPDLLPAAPYQRRRAQGDATGEAVRALKRRIARAVYQHLKQATNHPPQPQPRLDRGAT